MSLANAMKKFTKRAGNYIQDNSSTILVVLGLAGFGVAIYETAKNAPKAKEKLEELDVEIAIDCQDNHAPVPTKSQKLVRQAKVVSPIMAPTVILATFSSACIICAHKSNTKRVAALTTAYELSETARREYIARVKEKIGEKAELDIRDDYWREESQKHLPSDKNDNVIICTGHGDQLYYDEGSGRFFRASPQWLEKCKVEISHKIFCEDYASVNELYYIMGLPTVALGNNTGWNSKYDLNADHLIQMRWDVRSYATDWGEFYGCLDYEPNIRFRL